MARPLERALPGSVQESSGSDDGDNGHSSFTRSESVRQEPKGKRPKAISNRAAVPAEPAGYDARQDYESSCRVATAVLRARLLIIKAIRSRGGETP